MRSTSAIQLDREMLKGRFADLDPRFMLLSLCIAAVYGLVIWSMSGIPVPEPTGSDIRHLQRQFALLVLREEPVPEKETVVPDRAEKESARVEQQRKTVRERLQSRHDRSAEQTRDARRQAALDRARARQKAAVTVANIGALALISAAGTEDAAEEQVEDLLGDGRALTRQLSTTLSSLDGLKTGSDAGMWQRTGRDRRGDKSVTTGTGVEDLLTGIGTAQSLSLSRKTSVALARPVLEHRGGNDGTGGSRETGEINAVIREKLGAIQFCYKRELKRNPGLGGKITVRFSITPAGRVRDVRIVGGTIASSTMRTCLVKTVSMLRFKPVPAAGGVTSVTYPFVFSG